MKIIDLKFRRFLTTCLILTGFGSFGSILLAENKSDSGPLGRLLIDFEVDSKFSKDRWIVRALEQNLKRDLGTYPKLEIISKKSVDLDECKRDISCRLNMLKEKDIDIYIDGIGMENRVYWEVYHTITEMKLGNGVLKTGPGSSRRQLKMEAYKAVSAFLVKGGVFEQMALQKEYVENQEAIEEEKRYTATSGPSFYKRRIPWGILIVVALTSFVSIYLLVVSVLQMRLKRGAWDDLEERIRHKNARKDIDQSLLSIPIELEEEEEEEEEKEVPKPHPIMKFNTTYILVGSYTIIMILLAVFKTEYLGFPGKNIYESYGPYLGSVFEYVEGWSWVIPLPAGIIWGGLIFQVSRVLFPSLAGFEQLHPAGVFSTLKSWFWVSLARILVVAAVFYPFIWLAHWAVKVLDIQIDGFMTPIVPLLGLMIWGAVGAIFDLITLYFDCESVHGLAGDKNQWNLIVHSWLDHWVATQPYSPDLEQLKDVVFLPGKISDLVVYGGGFTRPRIVIHESLLFRAFRNEDTGALDMETLSEQVFPPAKDFLVGILLLGLAQVHRRNHWIHCITLVIRKIRMASPIFIGTLWDVLEELLWPYYSRFPVRLLDSYVCSHGCIDHLVQFLGYQLWRDPSLLTFRADKLTLRQQTKKILDRNVKERVGFEPYPHQVIRTRLYWIGRFTQSSADDVTKGIKIGWRAFAITMGLGLGICIYNIRFSWIYHSVYEARIEDQKKELIEKAKEMREKTKKKESNSRKI